MEVRAIKIWTIFERNHLNLTQFTCCDLSSVSFNLPPVSWSKTRSSSEVTAETIVIKSCNFSSDRRLLVAVLILIWGLNLSAAILETGRTSTSSDKVLKSGNISPTFLSPRHQVDRGGNYNPSKWQTVSRFVCQFLKESINDGELWVNVTPGGTFTCMK